MATKNPQRLALGKALKSARGTAGVRTPEVESALGWPVGKCSRVEAGARTVQKAEVDALAELYKVPAWERPTLHLLADAARKKETPSRVADFAQTYVTLERSARRIDYHDCELVHGLLQTEAYARELITKSGAPDVEARLAARLARQELLANTSLQLRMLLSEGVLYRVIGSEAITRAQLRHLLAVPSKLPNVAVRILPFAAGAHRGMGVNFTYLELDRPPIRRVYTEGFTSATYLHEDDETQVYAREFERIWAIAADDEESATILRRRIDN